MVVESLYLQYMLFEDMDSTLLTYLTGRSGMQVSAVGASGVQFMICDPDPMHVRNNRTTFVPVDLQDPCRMSAVVSNRHMLHVYNIPRKWKSAIGLGDVDSSFDSKRV